MYLKKQGQSGSVFTVLLAGIGLTAALSLTTYSIFTGPVSSISRITQKAMADTQMLAISKIAIMDAANQAAAGDCDADGFIEPREWRTTAGNKPTNGGLVPLTMGAPITDPWKSDYGYCVWDVGPLTAQAGCGGGGAGRLDGADNPVLGDAKSQTVMAVISSGQDRIFQTTCNAYVDGTTDVITTSGDDVVMRFSYQEAASATSSLWSLKSGDPDVAEIDKDLEIGADIAFDQAAGLIQAMAINATGKVIAGGGVTLGDETAIPDEICNGAQVGLVRYNSTIPGLEVCAGSEDGWQAAGSGGGDAGLNTTTPNIVITPGQQTGMNVDGSCGSATCYGTNVAFTVENYGQQDTDPLAATLSNLTNFEFVSNTCTGVVLAQNETCLITLRPKANGNQTYTGTLTVTSNNAPIAIVSGESTNFGCVIGRVGAGGIYAGCNVGSGYDFIVTSGGCSGTTTNPTCPGTADTNLLWTSSNDDYFEEQYNLIESVDGYQATVNAMAYSYSGASFPSAEYCYNLVYGGKDDWFLPSKQEITSYIYPNKATLGGFVNAEYSILNSNYNEDYVEIYMMNSGTVSSYYDGPRRFRCARREPSVAPTPSVDNVVEGLSFQSSLGGTANETRTSGTVTLRGITVPISVSVSGTGSPMISKNGGAYEAGPVTVSKGDTITLQALSPAVGTERVISVTAGGGGATWKVRTYAQNTIYAFVTSVNVLGGAIQARCNTDATAAGLGGTWVPLVSGSEGSHGLDTLPWNWNELRNMNNEVVATGLADYLDGTISAPINYTAAGALVSGQAWGGFYSPVGVAGDRTCNTFTDSTGNYSGRFGIIGATSDGEYLNSTYYGVTCDTNTNRGICIQQPSSVADSNPTDVYFDITMTTATTQVTSNTITVAGVNQPVNVSISASAEYRINGGAWVTAAGTATNGDTIQLRVTSDGDGTEKVVTLSLGDDNPTWKVRVRENNTAYAFVTSTGYTGNNVGGLAGADNICQTRAGAASLGGTWKAIISLDAETAATRIPWNWTTLKNLNGDTVVTNGMGDLFDGSLVNPINYTESGTVKNGLVWTNTTSSGTTKDLIYTCASFTTSGSSTYVGSSSATSGNYLDASNDETCGNTYALYCINDPDGAAVNFVNATEGYFVLTNASWDGALGGIPGANAKCLTDLTSNDWIGKTTANANGQLVAGKVTALLHGPINGNMPLPNTRYNFALSGSLVYGGSQFLSEANSSAPNNTTNWALSSVFGADYQYWTNKVSSDSYRFANGSAGAHCVGWTSNSGGNTGKYGRSNSTNTPRWEEGISTCDNVKRLLCIVDP